jgi:hypothetical protein
MGTTAVAPAPGGEQARIGAFGRVTGALFNPGPTFEDIARKPSWMLPLALLVILTLVLTYFLIPKVDWQGFFRQQMDNSFFAKSLSDADKDARAASQAAYAPKLSYVFGPGALIIIVLLIPTLVYWLCFNLFKGAGIRFSTAFSIMCHAMMPLLFSTILTTIVVVLKNYGEVNPEKMAASSLGFFLASNAPRWQISLGKSLDLFWIWSLVLMSIGFAAANPRKISKSSGYSIVFGVWLVWVVITVGLAAI